MFWYPWGKEAIDRAFVENKPILLSIGYSTCYWCHVMEREVFENLSIASQMNKFFINIKVDREEHPDLDEIYMVARQLLTQEGGWPNNIFLTPELKPFYAGGTYGPDDAYGKPGFPRLLEWLNYSWVTQEQVVRKKSDEITEIMKPFLIFPSPEGEGEYEPATQAQRLLALLKDHHDERSGGFFQAPKFPHECYLQFLLGYYEHSGDVSALDMVTRSLGKMAAGGIYDQVACGFHRYAVDKEWYVPHFEKMLYNQAMLAPLYTKAALITGNPFLADVARGILDFTAGPLTDGNGAFYAAIDAETDGVEGAYYAWTPEDLQALLSPEETQFFIAFYALADIPEFSGHKHAGGKVIIARKPLDLAAREMGKPYAELAALSGQVMNKLLIARNQRKAPHLDNKIILSWNGLMIAAYAQAGRAFEQDRYVAIARKAANWLLENAFDNEGKLRRIVGKGAGDIAPTLEDYAFFIHGLIALWRAGPENTPLLDTIESLMARTHELFFDHAGQGYFFTEERDRMLLRIKSGEDSTLPSANAVMLHNLIDLHAITGKDEYRAQAQALAEFFLKGNPRAMVEYASMLHGTLRLETPEKRSSLPEIFNADAAGGGMESPDDIVTASAALFPADAKPGETCELIVTLDIRDGWHINAATPDEPGLIPTQVDVQGQGVQVVDILYPTPLKHDGRPIYEGMVNITVRMALKGEKSSRPPLKTRIRCQPCHDTTCHQVKDISLMV